jgi:hypothetical protein
MVQSAIHLLKSSKNVFGLVLKACDCVGDFIEKIKAKQVTRRQQEGEHDTAQTTTSTMLLQLSQQIGDGMTDYGILLYLNWIREMLHPNRYLRKILLLASF